MPTRHTVSLTGTSLLTILLTMLHLADDYSRGFSVGDLTSLPVTPVLALWLYATLVLVERRSGHSVILLMSLLAWGISILHLTGKSGITGGAAPKTAGAVVFAWTLLALGTSGMASVLLSVRGLLGLRRTKSGVVQS
jgi:hypothetical protein